MLLASQWAASSSRSRSVSSRGGGVGIGPVHGPPIINTAGEAHSPLLLLFTTVYFPPSPPRGRNAAAVTFCACGNGCVFSLSLSLSLSLSGQEWGLTAVMKLMRIMQREQKQKERGKKKSCQNWYLCLFFLFPCVMGKLVSIPFLVKITRVSLNRGLSATGMWWTTAEQYPHWNNPVLLPEDFKKTATFRINHNDNNRLLKQSKHVAVRCNKRLN